MTTLQKERRKSHRRPAPFKELCLNQDGGCAVAGQICLSGEISFLKMKLLQSQAESACEAASVAQV
jgi:hypothetical protein